jgi:hypothetical protein
MNIPMHRATHNASTNDNQLREREQARAGGGGVVTSVWLARTDGMATASAVVGREPVPERQHAVSLCDGANGLEGGSVRQHAVLWGIERDKDAHTCTHPRAPPSAPPPPPHARLRIPRWTRGALGERRHTGGVMRGMAKHAPARVSGRPCDSWHSQTAW